MIFAQQALRIVAATSLAAILHACTGNGGTEIRPHHTIRHVNFEFTLSPQNRTDKSTGVTLLHIRPDGAATIRVSPTSGMLTALPGEYYECEEFGRRGLQLLEASPRNKTATFQLAGAISQH